MTRARRQCEATEHRKQVRVYDTKASRRPVLDVDVGDMPIKSIAVGHDGQYAPGISSPDARRGCRKAAHRLPSGRAWGGLPL